MTQRAVTEAINTINDSISALTTTINKMDVTKKDNWVFHPGNTLTYTAPVSYINGGYYTLGNLCYLALEVDIASQVWDTGALIKGIPASLIRCVVTVSTYTKNIATNAGYLYIGPGGNTDNFISIISPGKYFLCGFYIMS